MKTFFGMLLAVSVLTQIGVAQDAENGPTRGPRREIVVTGNGEITAAPDLAIVRLGATIQSAQANDAQAKVNEIIQAGLEVIEKLNIPKRFIKTSRLSLTPVYANQRPDPSGETREPRIIAYRANNTIEVTLEDISRVGKVIDAGIKAGANELQGVSFSLRNDLPQRTEALTQAAREAQTKAETIAKALSLRLGSVSEVQENGVHIMPQNEYFGGARMAMAGAVRTPVEPGEIKIQAAVTVHYQISR
jgi:uncharacterized protein YggE